MIARHAISVGNAATACASPTMRAIGHRLGGRRRPAACQAAVAPPGAEAMLRLAAATVAVGLADSLNPSTVGPVLYLATGRRPAARVTLFAAGVFAVNFAAGALLTLGPGRLIVSLLPHPQRVERSAIEIAAGAVLLAVAAALWLGRRSLARRELPMRGGSGSSALAAGASIAAVELPTAAPYFAIIAAIAASKAGVPQAIGLITLYCLAFVAPLLAIAVILVFAGHRANPYLERAGAWLQRRWPVVLAALLLAVGSGLIVVGAAGLLRG